MSLPQTLQELQIGGTRKLTIAGKARQGLGSQAHTAPEFPIVRRYGQGVELSKP
jgi:hypothetical protein